MSQQIPTLVKILVGFMFFLSSAAYSATYTVSELLPTPLDTPNIVSTVSWDRTDTGYPDDDDKVLVNIGFPFTFKDTAYSQVRILTNGVLHFGADQRFHRVFNNVALPTNSADRFIAPYWDDLVDDSQSSVTYGMKGSAPSRSFIVTWNNVRAYSNNLRYDFQVVLYENGDIRFRYDNNTANGVSATIGIEVDNSDVIQYSFNSSSVRTDFDLFFRNTLLSLPPAVLDIRMDELEWTGTSGEVLDSSPNALNGAAFGGALNSDVSPVIDGNPGTCRYGDFNGTNQYINIADNNALDMGSSFTVSAWVKIDSLPSSGLKTILSKDENYEFHVKPNGTINWWWQTNSPNATRQMDSITALNPGVWTHVAIRHQANNQTIFINGQASGSSSFTGTPVSNSDPLQIAADQNFNGRYFNGDIDEVRVFDQALSDAQMISLANETHFCRLAGAGCSSAFPDALSSYNDGVLTFTESGNSINSPDNTLQFSSISPAVNSFCNGAVCSAEPGNPVAEIEFGSFPDTSSYTQDFTINNNQTGTLGGGGRQQYDNVDVGQSATMNINAAVSTYYIDDLRIQRFATINLRPGDYWVRRLRVERDAVINVVGNGTARIFIRDDASFEQSIWFNPNDGFGLTGDASKLFLFAEGDIEFDRNTRFWGGIFAKGNISLARDALYEGGISASNISIDRNTTIDYDAGAMERLDFGSICQTGTCNFGGFQITAPSVALACPQSRAEIGFQTLCEDGVTPKTDYAGSVNLSTNEAALSRFYAAASGGSAITSLILDGSESGIGSVYVYHQNENSSLQVNLEDQTSSITDSVNIDFRSTGFAVTGPDDFTCGVTESMTIRAIGQVDNAAGSCALLTGFTGNKAISAWATANYEQTGPLVSSAVQTPILIDGVAISNSTQPGTPNLNLNFSAGEASVSVAHLDAAQILGLEFAHDDGVAGTPELTGSSGQFVVFPRTIKVTTSSVCTTGDHTCAKFVSAGSSFNMTATAVCADTSQSKASSYRSQSDIALSLNLVAPSTNAVNGVLAINQLAINDADNGEKTDNQSISEVGVFTISAQAPLYFGKTITQTSSDNIGRIYPDHFALNLNTPSFANSCNRFTYLDQEFFFNTAPQLTIEAKNAFGDITQNYEGDFWNLGISLQEQGTCNGVSSIKGFCYADNVGGAASFQTPNSSQSYGNVTNVNGQVSLTLHNQSFDAFTYSRPAANVLPFDADVALSVDLEDTDGVIGSLVQNNIGFASDTDFGSANYNSTNNLLLRHGRWKMENAYGPETQNLAIKAHAEYYTLQNKFEFNNDDNCTALTNSDISLNGGSSAAAVSVGSGSSTFSFNSPLNLAEDENFSLSSPGAANTGNVEVDVDLTNFPWLRYDWNQDGSLIDHPAIKASFGQYRGHDRIIYWREVAN